MYMTPMRIAFFTDTFLPQINGVATSIANVATELGRRGHQVLIITPKPSAKGPVFRADNVEVLYLPSIPAAVYPDFRMSPLIGFPTLFQVIKDHNPDIIHFHTTLMASVDALLAAKMLGKPLVGTNHIYLTHSNNDYLSFVSSNPHIRSYIASGILFYSMLFYRACDACIAPSRLLIEELQKNGIQKKFLHLPNAMPTAKRKGISTWEKVAIKKRLGLAERVVLHVGRLSREKCVDDVIKAFAIVRKSCMDVSLLIVGDGPDRQRLEACARELGVHEHTVFTGSIPYAELLASGLSDSADVFLTASPMESQGMVIVEAMACGLPIVAVEACAIPEMVGEAALLAAPHDTEGLARHVVALLESASLQEGMRRRSIERAAAFSPSILTDRLLQIYRSAMEGYRAKTYSSSASPS